MNKSGRLACLVAVVFAIAGCAGARHIDAKPQIVPPGTGRTIDFLGARIQVLLAGRATEGDVAVLYFVAAPRSLGAPPHVHQREDEYFYILEGEMRFLNDDRTVVAPAGTFAAMTRGHLHAFWNASDSPARVLLAVAPGGFANFFDEVVTELRASKTLDPATIRQTIVRFEKAHGIVSYPERIPEEAKPFLPR